MGSDIARSFRHQIVDLDRAREMLNNGATVGTADVLIGVYDVPDDFPAVGNANRQVIDQGAFRPFIDLVSDGARPFFVDHGDFTKGYTNSQLQIGVGRNFRDSEDGLYVDARWNLEKQVGREAFSDLVFEPSVWQFSFRNRLADEEHARGSDGFDHVTAFKDVREFSQVVWGAQGRTGALAETIAARMTDPDFRSWLLNVIQSIPEDAGRETPPEEVPAAGETPPPVTIDLNATPSTTNTATISTGTTTNNLLINSETVPAKVFSPSNHRVLLEELKGNPESRQALKDLLEEAERPDPIAEYLNAMWKGVKGTL